MTSTLKKAAIGSLAALSLAAGVLAGPTPASALHYGYWYPYGRYGGYHDWGGAVAAGVLGGVSASQPADLTVTDLANALPYSWAEQERRIGLCQQ